MPKKEAKTPAKPSTTPASTTPTNAPAEKCPEDCTKKVFPAKEVSETKTETISNAPAPYEAWNNTYTMNVKFRIEPVRASCSIKVTVKIKVTGTITDAQKAGWKSAIEAKWNGKVKMKCPDPACKEACPGGYAVSFIVEWVTSGEHYVVVANNDPADGVRSVTPDIGKWGVNDTVDITHEFGHMLGAPEEYFTTDGVDYTVGGVGFRAPGAGVMNNPAGKPLPRNYETVRKYAASTMGLTCTSEAA